MMNTGICASSVVRQGNASCLPVVPEWPVWNREWPNSASTPPARFPDSAESALTRAGVGHGGVPAMTHKVITLEFIVPTALAIVLGIALSVCAVYLADTYLFPVSQLEADYSAAVRR